MNALATLTRGNIDLELPGDLIDDYLETVDRIRAFFRERDEVEGRMSCLMEASHHPNCVDLTFNLDEAGIEIVFLKEQMQIRWRNEAKKLEGSRLLSSASLLRLGQFYVHEWHAAAFDYSSVKRTLRRLGIHYRIISTANEIIRLDFFNEVSRDVVMDMYRGDLFNGN